MLAGALALPMGSIIPPNEGTPITTSIRVPERILERLDKIAAAEGQKRTDIVLHFLRWAIATYDAEKAAAADSSDSEKKRAKK